MSTFNKQQSRTDQVGAKILNKRFPFILKDFDFQFIAKNGYIAICPVLNNISETYELKVSKTFADYERVVDGKNLMDEIFSTINRGYERITIVDHGNNVDSVGHQYFLRNFGDLTKQPIPEEDLPQFTPLYYRLNASSFELETDQSINRKKSAVYFLHPILFLAVCIWVDSRLFVSVCLMVCNINNSDDYIPEITWIPESTQTIPEVQSRQTESEWFRIVQTIFPEAINQYSVESFRIDSVLEREDSILLMEFDEKEHSSYDPLYEVNRYRRVLRTFMWTKKYIVWLRFSGRVTWNSEKIRDVFDSVPNLLSGQANIVYCEYSKIKHDISSFIPAYNIIRYSTRIWSYEFNTNAIQVWNVLKSKGYVTMNGSEILFRDDYTISDVMAEIVSIDVSPEDELDVIRKEYKRLKEVDNEEKEFLKEFEDAI